MTLAPKTVLRRLLTATAVPLLALAAVAAGGPAAMAATGTTGSGTTGTGTAAIGTAGSRGDGGSARPGRYLLSLGDSLGFGYQEQRISAELAVGGYSPDHFPGYVQPFASQLRRVSEHRQTVVNYSCPGETTGSMVTGPCDFAAYVHSLGYPRALHDDYTGSQLAAAVSFLAAHRNQVSPITVSLGANDLNDLFNGCARELTCVQNGLPGTLARLSSNLGTTLSALRSQAPHAEIIVLTPYNPAYVINPATDALLQAGDAAIATVAARTGARVADGFTAINLAVPGQEQLSVCTLTLMCGQQDIHPSDAGYQRLACALWSASGYARRDRDRHAA
ncbi:MAG TPA: SGNH/GDSL hydrolase family protein [Kineosporiaceae bacterium]|nr:SGNH/GDSL hydrolase family protein [Kineosporiaceae bacterium]